MIFRIKEFRFEDKDCDITLHTDDPDGRLFRTHKDVLCQVSKFFQPLFHGNLKTEKNVIKISGITDEMLYILLGIYLSPIDPPVCIDPC